VTDILLPRALRIARSQFTYHDNTGVSLGAHSGAAQTTGYGGDRVGASLNFASHGGRTALGKRELAQLRTLLMRMRGRQNRLLLTDDSYVRGGAFPAFEVLRNADFANGTADWAATGTIVPLIAVSDQRLRVTSTGNSAAGALSSTAPVIEHVPYAVRALTHFGRLAAGFTSYIPYFDDELSIASAPTFAVLQGTSRYDVNYLVPARPTLRAAPQVGAESGMAGDFFDIEFVSASRCLLADGPGNLLGRSDEFDNASWAKSGCTITANAAVAPNGSSTMDRLTEDTSTGFHFIEQGFSTTSSAQDLMLAVVVNAAGRSFCFLTIHEIAGLTSLTQYFNLTSGGSVGATGATGANWANRRAFTVNLGNNRVLCILIGRKTSAATVMLAQIGAASADGTASYAGSGAAALNLWRATVWPTSVPSRLVQSTSTTVAAQTQPGTSIYIKGGREPGAGALAGALLAGDWIEIDGQIRMLTAPLDLDSGGNGYLQFAPPLFREISDNTPIVVHRPNGRFMLSPDATAQWLNEPGVFSSASLDLIEVLS
jgi:hypothetical protein